MKSIEVDLTGCKCLDEIHERIRAAFDFPDWYGRNWDAFWDLLWSECDADRVVIRGEGGLPGELAPALQKMHEVLEDCIQFRRENRLEPFSYEIIG